VKVTPEFRTKVDVVLYEDHYWTRIHVWHKRNCWKDFM